MTILFPLPQEARNDPLKWNADWEVFINGDFAQPHGPAFCFDSALEALRDSQDGLKDSLEDYQTVVRSTCEIQRNLTYEALDHFANDDFENKWMLAAADERGKHILGALAAVCSKARNIHNARAYCPEIRLMPLSRDGKAFLTLLKSVMLEDASFIPTEPKSVPNAAWDTFAGIQRLSSETDEEKITLATVLLLRTKLISHVVHFTMRYFFGKETPPIHVQKLDQKPQRASPRPELIEVVGSKAAKARMKEAKAGAMDIYREQLDFCSYAGCAKPASNPSVRFSRCARCAKIERVVSYCSRECQRADWNGPHKVICGKALNFDMVSAAVEHPTHGPSSRPHIGLPVDGFKRSIPLIHQVTQLNLNPTVDYYLWNADNEPITFDFGPDTYPHFKFRELREGAMTTGDVIRVGVMAHSLCIFFSSDRVQDKRGVTPDTIVAQMAREYEVETDVLKKQVLELQMVQDYDSFHRPPLVWGAPLHVWENDNQVWNLSETRMKFHPEDKEWQGLRTREFRKVYVGYASGSTVAVTSAHPLANLAQVPLGMEYN
ncbi:MYND-type domain-containing protein [Favolaschia claudopus]|uniref:MYND-type domain-containing protein n=1 Tax=Favolaschia claudopus TaxID=2862362 RepID=A0AAW0B2X2_9AGAR